MLRNTYLRYLPVLLLSLLLASSVAPAEAPASFKVNGVQRIKQLTNYCGPACLAAVMRSFGKEINQVEIGREVYDRSSSATNGADMLLYARDLGFSAYSWNTSIEDVKRKLSAGVPVIVLQQNSSTDTSGHYRVLTGYDDAAGKFYVMDPYYDDITEMTYAQARKLWERMGYWALLVVPTQLDTFKADLGSRNPVVHMDLAYAKYKRGQYTEALKETNLALALEPRNTFALSMQDKIVEAIGAGGK